VILVGDIRDAGFRDAWITIRGRKAKGYACCLDQEDVMDPPPGPAAGSPR
jgi:hypothetical protein